MASDITRDLRVDVQSIELISKKAAIAEYDGDYDEAFKLYVDAAQSYLHIVRRGNVGGQKAFGEAFRKNLNKEAQKCLERAERIKVAKKNLTPLPKDPFSEGKNAIHDVVVVS